MPLPPANRRIVLATAVLAALMTPAAAQRRAAGDDVAMIHDRCVAFARANPK